MKKVILTEDQIKRMVDKLVINEQVTSVLPDDRLSVGINRNEENTTFQICNHFVVKEGDKWYFEGNKGEKIEVPQLSDIRGTVIKGGDYGEYTIPYPYDEDYKWFIKFEDIVLNGFNIGRIMYDSGCSSSTSSRGGRPFCYIDPNYVRLVGDKFNNTEKLESHGPTPVYTKLYTIKDRDHNASEETLERLKDKNGQVIEIFKTYTPRFSLNFGLKFGGSIYIKSQPIDPQPIKPITNPIVITFEKGLNDAFNFNLTTLNESGNKNLQDLINYAKQNYQGVSANVPVICSASIDGDPNQIIKGGITRSNYNMDLSKRRATEIANILTTQIGIASLKFIPQGIGETDQYDPGKKFPEIKDFTQTAGNRKLIIKLPKLEKQKVQSKLSDFFKKPVK